jgi:hypothetical protein
VNAVHFGCLRMYLKEGSFSVRHRTAPCSAKINIIQINAIFMLTDKNNQSTISLFHTVSLLFTSALTLVVLHYSVFFLLLSYKCSVRITQSPGSTFYCFRILRSGLLCTSKKIITPINKALYVFLYCEMGIMMYSHIVEYRHTFRALYGVAIISNLHQDEIQS